MPALVNAKRLRKEVSNPPSRRRRNRWKVNDMYPISLGRQNVVLGALSRLERHPSLLQLHYMSVNRRRVSGVKHPFPSRRVLEQKERLPPDPRPATFQRDELK